MDNTFFEQLSVPGIVPFTNTDRFGKQQSESFFLQYFKFDMSTNSNLIPLGLNFAAVRKPPTPFPSDRHYPTFPERLL